MFRIQSLAILAGLIVLFALVANALFGLFGALLAIGAAGVLNWLSARKAASFILRLHRARPLRPWEATRLQQVARGLASSAQIALPQLMVYPSETPNAFALSTTRDNGVVALSSRLLQLLDLREVRGVLAHEFAHLKNRDGKLNLAAGLFVRAISMASTFLGLSLLLLWLSGSWGLIDQGAWPLILIVASAPSAATLLHAALMRARERLADRDAARISGDARGLASALHKLHRYGEYLDRWRRRFRFIYTAYREPGHKLLHTHPSTEERVRSLLAMENELGTQALRPDFETRGPVRQTVAQSQPAIWWQPRGSRFGGFRLAG